jgi:hypothetical protein
MALVSMVVVRHREGILVLMIVNNECPGNNKRATSISIHLSNTAILQP